MKTYTVSYSGNASRFKNFETQVNADSEREAVENVYASIMDENYFPQEDGSVKDCDGHTVAEADDDTIEYDGGCFSAEVLEEEIGYTVNIYDKGSGHNNGEVFKDIESATAEANSVAKEFAEKTDSRGYYEYTTDCEVTVEDADGIVYHRVGVKSFRN